eukprot:13742-Heterococcus_DN1.PRE.2
MYEAATATAAWYTLGHARCSCVLIMYQRNKQLHSSSTMTIDAVDLYAKLKDKLDTDKWAPEAGEEYEDSEGNVLNRRTYEDLARQGLL